MKDILHAYGKLDVLNRYGKVAPLLTTFLQGKEIASKIVGENFVFLKRSTKNPPLYIEDFQVINDHFLQLRSNHHLDEVKDKLTPKQILLRQYFVPRKLINFFYACNNEYGDIIDRIFIDIDRQNNSADDARIVAYTLIKIIQEDKIFQSIIPDFSPLILRTGSSFHIYLLLKKTINHKFYDNYLSYGKDKKDSFPMKRAQQINKTTGLIVVAGHKRKKGAIIIDTSNTPPGKLARAPFSLHIKDFKTIDGISVPISQAELENPQLINVVNNLTIDSILENIDHYKTLLQK